jgi:hypothetical protein
MAVETIRTGPAMNAPELPADAPAAREGNMAATGSGAAVSGPTGPVWDALTGNPGATVAVIATAAGVSKTAARKALAAFEADGHATRSPGGRDGGKRTPDTWRPATSAEDADEAADDLPDQQAADQTGTAGTASAEADDDHSADADQAADGADTDLAPAQNIPAERASTEAATDESAPKESSSEDAASEDAASDHADDRSSTDQTSAAPAEEGDEGEGGMDGAVVTEARTALRSLSAEIGAAVEALESGDRSAALAAAESIYAGSGKARRLVRTAASGRPRSRATGRPRSNPGELRAKVVAHLTGHPGKEFTPHEIGKVINHSAGAVANALDRLVELGQAVVTCDRPRRFTASAGATAAEAASGEHTATDTDGKSAATDGDGDGTTGDAQEPTP